MKRPGSLVVAVAGVGAVAAVLGCIGLSRVVSKYVGETEKDLDRAFDAAEKADAELLFDESNALFDRDPGSDDDEDPD
jgi:SpoVK/Ycf46/Vps4 family AAA+-type ATPase